MGNILISSFFCRFHFFEGRALPSAMSFYFKKKRGGKGMSLYDRLYDESEQTQVRFIGFVSEKGRYDFGIVYTQMFFGKLLVICMQTGRSSLLSLEDTENLEYIQQIYNLSSLEEAEEVSTFLKNHLPALSMESEREI